MRAHDYTTLFKTAHMLKDVRLCLEEAQRAGVPFPAAAHARDLLSAAEGRGHGDEDYASMIEAVEGLADRRLVSSGRRALRAQDPIEPSSVEPTGSWGAHCANRR